MRWRCSGWDTAWVPNCTFCSGTDIIATTNRVYIDPALVGCHCCSNLSFMIVYESIQREKWLFRSVQSEICLVSIGLGDVWTTRQLSSDGNICKGHYVSSFSNAACVWSRSEGDTQMLRKRRANVLISFNNFSAQVTLWT